MNISKKPRYHFSYFWHFKPKLVRIDIKMGKTLNLFNVTRNISASHAGSNLLYPRVCFESIVLAVVV